MPWNLEKIISGGQTGADQGGIAAAKFVNYQTGGTAPKKFMTEDGPADWLGLEFGLRASPVDSYKSRTYKNVLDAEATIIFPGLNLPTPTREAGDRPLSFRDLCAQFHLEGGSAYTVELCLAHHRPFMINPDKPEQVREFIFAIGMKTLNIAGKRESKAPGMFDWVYEMMVEGLIPF